MKLMRKALPAALIPLVLGACCTAKVLDDYTLATPRSALRSFKNALEADRYDLEYRALSDDLKQEQDLTLDKYALGRDPFLRRHQPELNLFLKSEIEDVRYSPDGREAMLTLRTGSETATVVLRNEPFYRCVLDNEKVWDGNLPRDIPDLVTPSPGRIVVDFPVKGSDVPPGQVVDLRVTRAWRFYRIFDIEKFDFTTGPPVR